MFSFKKIFFQFAGKRSDNFRVDLESRNEIMPEDMLSDKATSFQKSFEGSPFFTGDPENQSKLEVPVRPLGILITFSLFFFVIFSTVVYMLYVHIDRGDDYAKMATFNAFQAYAIGPSRGDIVSSDDVVIASSLSVFDLLLNPSLLASQNIAPLVSDINALFGDIAVDSLRERVQDAQVRNIGELAISRSMPEDEAMRLDNLLSKYSQLELRPRSVRSYPYGSLYAHILGYTATVSAQDLTDLSGYDFNDQVGKKGVEFYFEDVLRGTDGLFAKIISSQGNIEGERLVRDIKRGSDIRLTINNGLQMHSREALQRALLENQISSGAIVALDPRNGSILSLVSLPDFDPNDFTQGLNEREFSSYFESSNKPLFNRATSGEYAVGSIIKPIIAVAALEENIIDPNKHILTHGFIEVPSVYDPTVMYRFNDWKDHGSVSMREAIAVSSNVYFYTIGGGFGGLPGLGIDKISDYLKRFNWGRTLGINFGTESAGFVPTPQWKEAAKTESWTIGDTYNVSIGQGDILATPLQVATATAVFANGGKLLRPNVISASNSEGEYGQYIINDELASKDSLNVVREGMREAVTNGSSRFLSQLPEAVAGKTGTAQASGGDNNAWFTGFAPYENPSIVITVLLERGIDSTKAVHVANEILQYYFTQK